MTESDDRPNGDAVYERGDVVYGRDPFEREEAARPWLVLTNHEGRPFHGDQCVALTLTTKSWLDGLVAIRSSDWIHGRTPHGSRLVPWGVQSLARSDIDRWQGRLAPERGDEAMDALVSSLTS